MRKVIVAFLAGMLVATSATAFADDLSKIGKKITGEFVVKLNGEELPVKAISLDGTSYIPVRAAGDALGLDVSFVNKEVILQSESLEQPVVTEPVKEEEGGDDRLTEEEFKNKIMTLQGDAAILDGKRVLIHLQLNKLSLEESKREQLQKEHDEYQAKIDAYLQEIEELKAEYPEYAESLQE